MDQLGGAVGALAEGWGIRAVARGGERAPTTAPQGLGEAAEPLQAFSPSGLHDGRGPQVPLEALAAWLRAGAGAERGPPGRAGAGPGRGARLAARWVKASAGARPQGLAPATPTDEGKQHELRNQKV